MDVKELSMAAAKQGELWGRSARDWAAIQERGQEPLWNAALDAAGVRANTRLLDAGCGAGGASVLAASRGATVFGIDVAVNLITIARQRLPHADFRIAEAEDLPFSNSELDAAVAINSLQFAANMQLAVHELGRVCRTGGRVVIAGMADPAQCDTGLVYRAIIDLFERPPASTGPFALSAPTVLETLISSTTSLQLERIDEIECSQDYPDLDTALRGQMSAGATWRAVEILGEDRVRTAVRGVLSRLVRSDGRVVMRNRYRYAVAARC
jgi:ubiquinone/menaquinone biosynthesis C-methylase UbiE